MSDSPAPSDPNSARRFTRKLRRASFILPQTGERSRRNFTLREASHRHHASILESEPLLDVDAVDNDVESDTMHHSSWLRGPWLTQLRDACCVHFQSLCEFASSSTGVAIFKCSLAYLLASMATLIPAFSSLFGHQQDAKHMVATVTVWFHPARTVGSMHEAVLLSLIALCYAAVISFTSMSLSVFFGYHDMLSVGHGLVLVIFVGGGLGFVAWNKQRFGRPLVNVACSLASLGCITVLVREGSVQTGQFSTERVVQVLRMVSTGVAIAMVINLTILPALARKRLIKDLQKNTDLLGEMLICVTRAFLQGRESDLNDNFYKTLSQEHQTSLASMKQNLSEAKREHLVLGTERLFAVEARLVECLIGLAQDLGGLRSAAMAQFAFLNEETTQPVGADSSQRTSQLTSPMQTPSQGISRNPSFFKTIGEAQEEQNLPQHPSEAAQPSSLPDRFRGSIGSLAALTDVMESNILPRNGEQSPRSLQQESPSLSQLAKNPAELFITFMSQLGPPTKSLVYTLKQILDDLPFKQKHRSPGYWNPWTVGDIEVAVNNQLHNSLRQAIDLYRQSRKEALQILYRNRSINAAFAPPASGRTAFKTNNRSASQDAAVHLTTEASPLNEGIVADVEEVTACCGHFSFSLLDFAEDVIDYLEILDDMKDQILVRHQSWTWLLFWRNWKIETSPRLRSEGFFDPDREQAATFDIPLPIRRADDFINLQKSAIKRPWYYRIYLASRFARRDDVQFAIKVGLGAALYALPAFLRETRPFFVQWRGEWGLVSYMAVCCMTIGASNTTGLHRCIGTMIGAGLAVMGWILSSNHGQANPWILGLFGWLVSIGCFYIILGKNNGPMGRFILLTYNLGALYSYSLSMNDNDNDDDEGGVDPAIWYIVLHRLVAVVVGTLWGIVVCRWIWPISARKKLAQGLCILWLRMALIWKRDPLAMFLLGEPVSSYMDIREESEFQAFLANLRSLRTAATSEFEFRGPFPTEIIGRMLDRCGRMLDAFHAMNVVISKTLQCTPGEAAVLKHTRAARFQLSARISHLFTVLASGMKMEYPMNDVLPTIDNSRDRLLASIAEYRRSAAGRELTIEHDYEMLYAYVLVTGQLAEDIMAVGEDIGLLFRTLNEENLKMQ